MAEITLEEARELAKTFGELDQYDTVLLLLFTHTTSKWDLLDIVKKLPKSYRIPQATLYRRVNALRGRSFLDVISSKTGRAGMIVNSYRLSLKGLLAAGISAYATFLDPAIPITLKEKTQAAHWAQVMESALGPAWALYIDFLKWHRERCFDLSNAKIDMAYFGAVLFLSMLDHPETVTEERMQELSKPLMKLGLAPSFDPDTVPARLKEAKTALQNLGSGFLFRLLERTKQSDSSIGREAGI
jgi:hypothetical protein